MVSGQRQRSKTEGRKTFCWGTEDLKVCLSDSCCWTRRLLSISIAFLTETAGRGHSLKKKKTQTKNPSGFSLNVSNIHTKFTKSLILAEALPSVIERKDIAQQKSLWGYQCLVGGKQASQATPGGIPFLCTHNLVPSLFLTRSLTSSSSLLDLWVKKQVKRTL